MATWQNAARSRAHTVILLRGILIRFFFTTTCSICVPNLSAVGVIPLEELGLENVKFLKKWPKSDKMATRQNAARYRAHTVVLL